MKRLWGNALDNSSKPLSTKCAHLCPDTPRHINACHPRSNHPPHSHRFAICQTSAKDPGASRVKRLRSRAIFDRRLPSECPQLDKSARLSYKGMSRRRQGSAGGRGSLPNLRVVTPRAILDGLNHAMVAGTGCLSDLTNHSLTQAAAQSPGGKPPETHCDPLDAGTESTLRAVT
jgi:hypothetical protein